MWFLKSLADVLLWLFRTLWDVAGKIPALIDIGGWLSGFLKDVASHVLDAEGYIRELDEWADDLVAQVRDFLTWEGIKDRIVLWLPWVNWGAREWVDFLWWRWVFAFEDWLEARLDWVWRVGYRLLDKLW